MLQQGIDYINNLLSGPIMVWGVVFVGIIMTIQTRFVQVRKLKESIVQVVSSLFKKRETKVGISPFQAVTTALAGTIGTGNIVGVATAISIGGAGSIFWMWVSAFFGMATKYAEIVLAIKYREKRGNEFVGGPMYYLMEAFKTNRMAKIFAFLCIISSFGIGNMVQANAVSDAIISVWRIDTRLIGIIVGIVVAFVIIGGIKRIAKITEGIIPIMAIFYIGGCFAIIILNSELALKALIEIVTSAFKFSSVGGGVAGFLTSKAMKVGFARGVFTNESGLGSAPIAHAAADAKSPSNQGLMGIFEVFFDTIIMCSLTGIVVVIFKLTQATDLTGAALTLAAFSEFLGDKAAIFIAISTVFFAISTIVSWSYYGQTCVSFLSKKRSATRLYKVLYIIAIYVGAVTTIELVWGVADIFNSLMMIPNLIGVVMLSSIVRDATE